MNISEFFSPEKLTQASASIAERIEHSGKYSELFVDASVLPMVIPIKNQAIYGRRGTGKTHLLGRLAEYYNSEFAILKTVPVFVDGRKIAFRSVASDANPIISLILAYRRLLDTVIDAIGDFTDNEITLSFINKIWPVNEKNKKLTEIKERLHELRRIVRFGQVEIIEGKVGSEIEQVKSKEMNSQIAIDAKLSAEVKKLAENKASFSVGLKRATSSTSEEKLKVVYEGLTVINYTSIRENIERILDILDAESLVVLFDEWSAIEINDQPVFAEMIRSTLIGGKHLGIKFACIPFLTQLSEANDSGQTIGFPIGEEVFIDVDLDRLCSPYANANNVTIFLFAVLQKHLAGTISELKEIDFSEWMQFCLKELFEGYGPITELVKASAGVPRDFLRIFNRSIQGCQGILPLTSRKIRRTTHEFFQEEKAILIQRRPEVSSLFEDIFDKICVPSNTYIFFVSSKLTGFKFLKEIWHHRLIHLLFQGHPAYAGDKLGTYDIYVMDYGRYVLMRNTKRGEQAYRVFEKFFNYLLSSITPLPFTGLLKIGNIDDSLKKKFSKLAAEIKPGVEPDIEAALEDCSKYVIDGLLHQKE
jgi:hypothetical protein